MEMVELDRQKVWYFVFAIAKSILAMKLFLFILQSCICLLVNYDNET